MKTWDAQSYHFASDHQVQLAQEFLSHFRYLSPSTICDVGCGSGRVTRMLADLFPKAMIYGIDPDVGMLEHSKKSLADLSDRIALILSDVLFIKLPKPMNLIFSNFAFHWICDQHLLFKKLHDLLTLDGLLVAQWPTCEDGEPILKKRLRLDTQFNSFFLNWSDPVHYSKKEEVETILTQTGFRKIQIDEFHSPIQFDSKDRFLSFARTVELRHYLLNLPNREIQAHFLDTYAQSTLDRMGKYELEVDVLRVIATK